MAGNFITIRLTRAQAEYLRNASFISPNLYRIIGDMDFLPNGCAALSVNLETMEEFRDAFTEELAKVGFDDNYEPTTEGKMLEELVDIFYSEYLSWVKNGLQG